MVFLLPCLNTLANLWRSCDSLAVFCTARFCGGHLQFVPAYLFSFRECILLPFTEAERGQEKNPRTVPAKSDRFRPCPLIPPAVRGRGQPCVSLFATSLAWLYILIPNVMGHKVVYSELFMSLLN